MKTELLVDLDSTLEVVELETWGSPETLTFEQIMEIRKQPDWINATNK